MVLGSTSVRKVGRGVDGEVCASALGLSIRRRCEARSSAPSSAVALERLEPEPVELPTPEPEGDRDGAGFSDLRTGKIGVGASDLRTGEVGAGRRGTPKGIGPGLAPQISPSEGSRLISGSPSDEEGVEFG